MNIGEQLAHLRQTVARIDRKYEGLPAPPPARKIEPNPAGFVEELLSGEVVETPLGKHFETEKLYARHKRHGSFEISDLIELPHDVLDSLSGGAIPRGTPWKAKKAGRRKAETARLRTNDSMRGSRGCAMAAA